MNFHEYSFSIIRRDIKYVNEQNSIHFIQKIFPLIIIQKTHPSTIRIEELSSPRQKGG